MDRHLHVLLAVALDYIVKLIKHVVLLHRHLAYYYYYYYYYYY